MYKKFALNELTQRNCRSWKAYSSKSCQKIPLTIRKAVGNYRIFKTSTHVSKIGHMNPVLAHPHSIMMTHFFQPPFYAEFLQAICLPLVYKTIPVLSLHSPTPFSSPDPPKPSWFDQMKNISWSTQFMNLLSTQTPPITLHLLTPTPVPQHSIPNTVTLYYLVTARDAFTYTKRQGAKLFFCLF